MGIVIFRKAEEADIPAIWEIIQQAKQRMCDLGRHQWTEKYPAFDNIKSDIANGGAYVACSPDVAAYAYVTDQEEPAYNALKGQWLSVQPYIVVHRLAVRLDCRGLGLAKFIFSNVETLCANKKIHSIKVDTNYDNVEMLHLLPALGFAECGTVEYPQGQRIAFEKIH
jgi:L-amino acid N-acyltransferase YncA